MYIREKLRQKKLTVKKLADLTGLADTTWGSRIRKPDEESFHYEWAAELSHHIDADPKIITRMPFKVDEMERIEDKGYMTYLIRENERLQRRVAELEAQLRDKR